MQRESNAPIAVVTAPPTPPLTPLPQPSSPATPSPQPSSPTTPSPAPSSKQIALASPSAAASPSATPRASVAPPALAPHAVVVITPAPSREPASVRTPAPAATVPSYAVVATAEARATPTDEADSDFARLSAAVVRAYLAALVRGDEAGARAALDPSKPRDLGEREFVDTNLRITSLDAHGTNDSATVNVDMTTTRGEYFEQFYLRRTPAGAAVIVDHTYIKP